MFSLFLTVGCTFFGTSDVDEILGGSSRNDEAVDQQISFVSITSAEELQAISNNLNNHYQLENDIDLSGVTWTPIGTTNSPFNGTLDGNGHTISNLSFGSEAVEHIGLFGVTDTNSKIYDLNLENFTVKNKKTKAACNEVSVGYSDSCSAGALVGYSRGEIELVQLFGNGNTITGSYNVGGLIGIQAEGFVRKVSAKSDISEFDNSGSYNLGGLIGHLEGYGTFVSNSYAVGDVSAPNSTYVGGLVGHLDGSIAYSYVVSSVAGSTYTGLFVGRSTSGGDNRVAFSFAIPAVGNSATSFQGAGIAEDYFYIKYVYTNNDDGCMGGNKTVNSCLRFALTNENLENFFKGNKFEAFDYENTWQANDGDYPTLRTEGRTIENFAGSISMEGSGLIDDPYIIETTDDWNAIAEKKYYFNSRFKLKNHLNFSGVTIDKIKKNESIIKLNDLNETESVNAKLGFSAVIDGNNKTMLSPSISGASGYDSFFPTALGTVVKDLNISGGEVDSVKYGSYFTSSSTGLIFDNVHIYNPVIKGDENQFGIFCAYCHNAIVKNSSVYNALISKTADNASGKAGVVFGYAKQESLMNTSVSGRIENFNNYVGGVVGQVLTYSNFSQVKCDVDITLKDNQPFSFIGGFIGYASNRVFIYDSYAEGTIKSDKLYNAADGDNYVGGFIGFTKRTYIYDSYANVDIEVDAAEACGTMVGFTSNSFQSNSLFSFGGGYCRDADLNYVGSGTGGGGASFYVQDGSGSCFVDANNGLAVEKCKDITQAEMVGILNDPDKIFSDNAVLGVSLGWDPTIWKIINGGPPKLKLFD